MIDDLNDSNIILFAVKCYDKPNCIMSEFEEDYKRFSYIKRLIQRYRISKEIKERLLLNHLVICQNVFGVNNTTRILFYKIDKEDYSCLKAFLILTNAMPDVIYGIEGRDINSSDIPLDNKIIEALRKI